MEWGQYHAQLNIRLTKQEFLYLERISKDLKISKSEFLRKYLNRKIAEYKKRKTKAKLEKNK